MKPYLQKVAMLMLASAMSVQGTLQAPKEKEVSLQPLPGLTGRPGDQSVSLIPLPNGTVGLRNTTATTTGTDCQVTENITVTKIVDKGKASTTTAPPPSHKKGKPPSAEHVSQSSTIEKESTTTTRQKAIKSTVTPKVEQPNQEQHHKQPPPSKATEVKLTTIRSVVTTAVPEKEKPMIHSTTVVHAIPPIEKGRYSSVVKTPGEVVVIPTPPGDVVTEPEDTGEVRQPELPKQTGGGLSSAEPLEPLPTPEISAEIPVLPEIERSSTEKTTIYTSIVPKPAPSLLTSPEIPAVFPTEIPTRLTSDFAIPPGITPLPTNGTGFFTNGTGSLPGVVTAKAAKSIPGAVISIVAFIGAVAFLL